jgi:hypothetical protein
MARAMRRRAVVFDACVLAMVVTSARETYLRRSPLPLRLAAGLGLAVLVIVLILKYSRIRAVAGRHATDEEVTEAARGARACGRCSTTVLGSEAECPQCGLLQHPRAALLFGIAFGIGMFLLALWRTGWFAR